MIDLRAVKCVLELEPHDGPTYVLLSNTYVIVGKWSDVAKVRKMMKDRAVRKEPTQSWIEVEDWVHTFVVGDKSHPKIEEIYANLEDLVEKMKEAGTLYILFSIYLYGFANAIKRRCPRRNPNGNTMVPMETITPTILDNVYYGEVLSSRGLFTSYRTLLTQPTTASMVMENWFDNLERKNKFKAAMVKTGEVGVLTGSRCEIHLNC
eukprot:Gb_24581 [translate_table: standard]